MTPLAARLEELSISVEEAAGIARLEIEDVQAMVKGDAEVPDVPFRWLADDADAVRRVDQLRRTRVQNLESDAARAHGMPQPSYGGFAGTTGGLP